MEGTKKAQEAFTQSAGKAVETLSVWADANQRVMRELAELSAVTANSLHARGLGGAFRAIGHDRYGPPLLGAIALGFIATMTAAAWAIPGDIVDRSQAASLGAIQNFGGYFGGAFAPLLTGMIADRTGSYVLAFVIGGIIASLAAVAYMTLVRRPLGRA